MHPVLTPAELEALLTTRLNLSSEEKEAFISPSYSLGDLFAFTDMEKAVARLYQAVKGSERIGIYADYDCDGIPGAVVLIDLFKKLDIMDRVDVYIPDRHDEGYGVSSIGISELEKKGVTVMITVDVGITAIAEVADAQSRGIDVILTDHHAPLSEFPAAYALIHPAKSTYINQDPCGAAVAFYLVCAFLERHGQEWGISKGWEKWLLDLVGFATLSDMMPLRGQNRMLVAYGLHVMRNTRRIGIKTLLEKNSVALPNLIETDLTFTVAPRLNAASRMATPMLAFELLSTADQTRALDIVKTLDRINNERKVLVAQIVKAAHASLGHRILGGELGAIVVIGNPEWRPAVLGLVANKLQEKYGKSFFVWGEGGDGSIKGSCRMMPEHHAALIFQSLPPDTLIHAGGHQAAGGFAVSKEKIHFLEEALNKAVSVLPDQLNTEDQLQTITMTLGSATSRHLSTVRKFAPFGIGNTEPYFSFERVIIVSTKMFGKNKEHIECVIRDGSATAIAFTFFADDTLIGQLVEGATVTIVGTIEAGWRGGVRIRIKEVR
jgi:single-stranded-DNA-specific exonuclease